MRSMSKRKRERRLLKKERSTGSLCPTLDRHKTKNAELGVKMSYKHMAPSMCDHLAPGDWSEMSGDNEPQGAVGNVEQQVTCLR